MVRPRKAPQLRKDADLRIPMTADQKRLVVYAATLNQQDMAAWVRPLLLEAAEATVEANSRRKPRRKRG